MNITGLDPEVIGFIKFCLDRKGKTWPVLYDEMCLVAGQRLYKGLGYDDLNKRGMSLALGNINNLIQTVELVHRKELLQKTVRK